MAHAHSHNNDNNIRAAFFLNLVFTLFEISGGFWTNSLAILSNALHDVGDSLSLGLSWYLEKYSRKKMTDYFLMDTSDFRYWPHWSIRSF